MRSIGLLILAGMLGSGCAPHASFKPETIEVKKHSLVIKGWTQKDQFCIELELKPGNKVTSLHSVALVTPDGKKLDPASWDDRTREPPRISVGFGVGGIDCDGGAPAPGKWTNLVGTFDGRTARLFQDGRLVAEKSGNANRAPWKGPLHVGQYSGGPGPEFQVAGWISNLRIYARAVRLEDLRPANK